MSSFYFSGGIWFSSDVVPVAGIFAVYGVSGTTAFRSGILLPLSVCFRAGSVIFPAGIGRNAAEKASFPAGSRRFRQPESSTWDSVLHLEHVDPS